MQKCRAFNKPEGRKCIADCACAEGLECFIRERKQSKQPDGSAKGRCRLMTVDEPTNEEQAQDEE
jgi:hypothetical protein